MLVLKPKLGDPLNDGKRILPGAGTGGSTGLTRAVVATVTLTTLFWWTGTDRLDLPKLAIFLLGALVAGALALANHRGLGLGALGASGLALLAVLGLQPEIGARIEGWAGWIAALVLFAAAREAEPRRLGPPLATLALGLAAVGLLQGLGLEVFNAELSRFGGRRVVGTLGGPGHFGWVLAALAPFAGAQAVSRFNTRAQWPWVASLALLGCGLILCGSRVAWVMAAVTLPFWVRRRDLWRLGLALVIAIGVATGVDAIGGRADLGGRVSDVTAAHGTAAGRFYLWRVYGTSLPEWIGIGEGPEGFQRRWPGLQAEFLARHPEDAPFRSDLRHAHADLIEIGIDFGIVGLLIALACLFWLLHRGRRAATADPQLRPALGALIALLVGGLAAPLLHFAPTLATAAAVAGLVAGPPGIKLPRGLAAAALIGPLIAGGLLGERLRSETLRSAATHARLSSPREARALAEQAVAVDKRNPRAWMEVAMAAAATGDLAAARDALRATARDLPTDEVNEALAAMEAALPAETDRP